MISGFSCSWPFCWGGERESIRVEQNMATKSRSGSFRALTLDTSLAYHHVATSSIHQVIHSLPFVHGSPFIFLSSTGPSHQQAFA